jgi:hypothetical protein
MLAQMGGGDGMMEDGEDGGDGQGGMEIVLSEEDAAAVARLQELGFDEHDCVQAYMVRPPARTSAARRGESTAGCPPRRGSNGAPPPPTRTGLRQELRARRKLPLRRGLRRHGTALRRNCSEEAASIFWLGPP